MHSVPLNLFCAFDIIHAIQPVRSPVQKNCNYQALLNMGQTELDVYLFVWALLGVVLSL